MGAQSATGVSGPGSVEATAKGPKERGFVGVEKLIGPRVMLAATVTLAGGAATYNFPSAMPLGKEYYCVVASAANAVTVTKVETSDVLTGVTLAGTGTDVVDVVLVNVGSSL